MAKAKRKAMQKREAVKKSALKAKKEDFWVHLAFALGIAAVIFLALGGLYSIFAREKMAQEVSQVIEAELKKQAIDGGDVAGILSFVFAAFGVLWVAIAILMGITISKIEKTGSRRQKIFLLFISIITMVSGRFFDAGILSLISAIIYLRSK